MLYLLQLLGKALQNRSEATIMETKKHFVIAHNAFHGAWLWDRFKPLLEAEGHEVTTFDLAASGNDPRDIDEICSADAYTEPLLDVVRGIPEGEKVILVGHSFGGVNAAMAMDKYPQKVAVAVFLNAFVPDTANKPSYVLDKYMEIFDDFKDCEVSTYSCGNKTLTKMLLGPNFLRHNLYNMSPDEDVERAIEKTRWASFFREDLAVREKFTEEGYGSVPTVSIICEKDEGIPAEYQRWMAANFGVEKVYEIDGADHSPMCSSPSELLNILLDIARSNKK